MSEGNQDNSRNLQSSLANLCGEAHVVSSGPVPAVAPADVEELSAVLQYANREGVRLSTRGAGTKASWMGELEADAHLLTRRMSVVSEHVWQDMTCTVGAGCTWSDLQTVLEKHGQWVALDPLWPEEATVGGVLSSNDSGVLRLAYGGLRDLVIGMTYVLADGTIARSGGKVVKNVAGYDMHKLMCGAYGTLGVIAEVTFRLHSVPRSVRNVSVASDSAKPLQGLLHRILDSHLNPQSLQLRANSSGYVLDLRLAAMPEALETHSGKLVRFVKEAGLTIQDAPEEVWVLRQGLVDTPGGIVFKATMLPAHLGEAAGFIASLGGDAVAQATGIFYGRVPEAQSSVLTGWRAKLKANGGSLVFLNALPPGERDRWGIAADTRHWMSALKQQLDPHAILNPGCFGEAY